jgi:hypothetical protein
MNNFSNLKEGDQISIHSNAHIYDRIVKVEKITPTGLIKAAGMTFYPDGQQKGKHEVQWCITSSNISGNRQELTQ